MLHVWLSPNHNSFRFIFLKHFELYFHKKIVQVNLRQRVIQKWYYSIDIMIHPLKTPEQINKVGVENTINHWTKANHTSHCLWIYNRKIWKSFIHFIPFNWKWNTIKHTLYSWEGDDASFSPFTIHYTRVKWKILSLWSLWS